MKIGTVINDLRRRKGMSYDELVAKSGCSLSCVISLLHNETQNPKPFTIRKLCAALDISTEDFKTLCELDENTYMDRVYHITPCALA